MEEKIEAMKILKGFFETEWNATESEAKILAIRCVFGWDVPFSSECFRLS